MRCLRCGTDNRVGARYCEQCGQRLEFGGIEESVAALVDRDGPEAFERPDEIVEIVRAEYGSELTEDELDDLMTDERLFAPFGEAVAEKTADVIDAAMGRVRGSLYFDHRVAGGLSERIARGIACGVADAVLPQGADELFGPEVRTYVREERRVRDEPQGRVWADDADERLEGAEVGPVDAVEERQEEAEDAFEPFESGSSIIPYDNDDYMPLSEAELEADWDIGDREDDEDELGLSRTARIVRAVLIGLVVLVVVAGVVVALSIRVVTFDANGAESGSLESVWMLGDNDITLPENPYTHEDYVFAGWGRRADSQRPMPAGSESYVTESCTYYAIWQQVEVTASFEGAGADMGSMDDITLLRGDKLRLPSCSYGYGGHVFSYWVRRPSAGESAGDGTLLPLESYGAGDKVDIFDDATFEAVWQIDAPEGLALEDTRNYEIEGGGCNAFAFVRNTTDHPYYVEVVFKFFDANDKELGSSQDGATYIGSKKLALFMSNSLALEGAAATKAVRAECVMRAFEPVSFLEPLPPEVRTTEVSCTDDTVTFEVTNESDRTVFIYEADVFGDDGQNKEGTYVYSPKTILEPLEAGASKTFEFSTPIGSESSWDSLRRRIFLDGCAY